MKAQLYRDVAGEWRWRIIADNGEQIADSGEGYVRRIDAVDALRLVNEHVDIESD